MAISQLTRYKLNPGAMEEVLSNCKRAKSIFDKHDIEARFGMVHSGAGTGQLVVATRYPDWEAFGKGQSALRSDADYQRLMSDVEQSSAGELESRTIIESIDV